jgi:hypothetical protein
MYVDMCFIKRKSYKIQQEVATRDPVAQIIEPQRKWLAI